MSDRERPCWEVVERCEDGSHLQPCEWGAGESQEGAEGYSYLSAGYDDQRSGFRVKLSWSAHLSLMRADKRVLTPESLRESLAELRRKQVG
jgi:hypothetical protein